jgi:hypothetical protein
VAQALGFTGLGWAKQCHAMPRHAGLRYARPIIRYTTLRGALRRHAMLCHGTLRGYAMLRYARLCQAVPHGALARLSTAARASRSSPVF